MIFWKWGNIRNGELGKNWYLWGKKWGNLENWENLGLNFGKKSIFLNMEFVWILGNFGRVKMQFWGILMNFFLNLWKFELFSKSIKKKTTLEDLFKQKSWKNSKFSTDHWFHMSYIASRILKFQNLLGFYKKSTNISKSKNLQFLRFFLAFSSLLGGNFWCLWIS